MTTHVFIVDSKTFKVHLENLFAGTGAGDNIIDFNNVIDTSLHSTTENNLVSMIADGQRIRQGDYIIFYLQQNFQENIRDGKFYGIFKAKNDWSFLDHNDASQYLINQLEKSLTFRTLIEPYKVYSKGVTEWEALDEIKNIQSPNQMLWSLIYRKLKGNRGNTMITIYEAERLFQLIRNKNNREELNLNNKKLTFDSEDQLIKILDGPQHRYEGRQEEIRILPRLINKYIQRKSFESHLQAFIVQFIGKLDNLDLILEGRKIEWLGNEVSCGVGMQRIDVMVSVDQDNQRTVIPIELKSVEAKKYNVNQIQRYVDWLEQYYIPNRQSDIEPILIAKKLQNKDSQTYRELVEDFNRFNNKNRNLCKKLVYIEISIKEDNIVFEKVDY